MGCAKPVIYSGAGEGARLVAAAEAGLVVPPADPDALAAAVCTLVDHPRDAAEMGRRGRAYVEANLAWDPLVADWLTQLESALDQRARR